MTQELKKFTNVESDMNLKFTDNSNVRELEYGDVTLVFSYEKLVIMHSPRYGVCITEEHFSNTTRKHIDKWLEDNFIRKWMEEDISIPSQLMEQKHLEQLAIGEMFSTSIRLQHNKSLIANNDWQEEAGRRG